MKTIRLISQIAFFGVFLFVIINGNMFMWLGLFIVSLILAAVFGRFYCGYICPMSTVMGVTGKLAKKMKWQTKSIPRIFQSRILPWLVLLVMAATMVFSKKILHQELPILIVLMAVAVLLTLRFEEWVFHNHVCPYGPLLNLSGKWAKFSTKVDPSLCIGCKKCETVCPSQAVKVDGISRVAAIDPSICHQCQACTSVCPKEAIRYRG